MKATPPHFPPAARRGHITKRKGEHTMKFNNIFEQIIVELLKEIPEKFSM